MSYLGVVFKWQVYRLLYFLDNAIFPQILEADRRVLQDYSPFEHVLGPRPRRLETGYLYAGEHYFHTLTEAQAPYHCVGFQAKLKHTHSFEGFPVSSPNPALETRV